MGNWKKSLISQQQLKTSVLSTFFLYWIQNTADTGRKINSIISAKTKTLSQGKAKLFFGENPQVIGPWQKWASNIDKVLPQLLHGPVTARAQQRILAQYEMLHPQQVNRWGHNIDTQGKGISYSSYSHVSGHILKATCFAGALSLEIRFYQNTNKVWARTEGNVQDKLLWRGQRNEGMVIRGTWAILNISDTSLIGLPSLHTHPAFGRRDSLRGSSTLLFLFSRRLHWPQKSYQLLAPYKSL